MSEYIFDPPASLPRGSDVIAYLRDSGGPRQEDSIGQQERVITAYCKQHGLILTRVYADTASGRKTKKRDQFLDMYHTIESMHEDLRPRGLLLWAYSRFSRDIVDFNFYLYGLLKHGLAIHSITEAIPEGLAGQILLSLKAYKNAEFSEELGKQIKRGISDRVHAGYCNGGQAPRGYRVVRDSEGTRRNGQQRIGVKWEVDPELAPLVRLAWELRAEGKSYGEITEATMSKVYSIKNSWTSHFRNVSYLGIGKAGGEKVPNHHEAIITPELWDAVKKVEEAMPHYGRQGEPMHPRRIKHPSLLSGLSFCVHCGAAMVLHTEKDYRSYACGKRERQRGYKDCQNARRVNARKADAAILDAILNQILSPAFVGDLLDDIQKQMVDTSALDHQIEDAYTLLDLTNKGINRLVRLAKETDELAEITREINQQKMDRSQLEARIKTLKAERDIDIPEIAPEALALVFSTWREQIQAYYQTGDILNAKKLISRFVQKIELGRDTAIIHYTQPAMIPADNVELFSAHWQTSEFFKNSEVWFCGTTCSPLPFTGYSDMGEKFL
ncbi:MAG TPA: recombinase family protein [Anaerolineales bacterium]|nr:recombinase family protein [Anaerolineales bacterium]HNQ94417.1 recombinase family protein [Anaerolineales bacterium]HNS61274.1 recombinase family protein [Anaerolineales bacterium]